MILESNFPYSTNTVRYRSNKDPLLVDFVKKLLHVNDRNGYQDNNVSMFYNKLLSLSKHWGLGEHISVETVFDEFTPEYIFTISIPSGMSKEEENDIFMKMNFQMERFCKDNNMFSFLKDAYIIFE